MGLRRGIGLALALCMAGLLPGCTAGEAKKQERSKVPFTVVEERQLPQELLQAIEQNKQNEIRMTYADGGELYLIRGYGEQKTGGYSIAVADCSEDEEAVYFDTRLIGPPDPDHLQKEPSCPYLAVRMKERKKDVKIT